MFVAVTMAAVYVRRFGPRGFALGMAGFMPYFFTQFLQARPAELPWLLVAAVTGLGATLLLRGYVFAEWDDRTLARLLRAFRAHVHGLVVATAALLAAAGGPADRGKSALHDTRRRRTRLNRTALLVADRLDLRRLPRDPAPRGSDRADPEAPGQRVLDVELAAERLAIATRRVAEVGGPRGDDRDTCSTACGGWPPQRRRGHRTRWCRRCWRSPAGPSRTLRRTGDTGSGRNGWRSRCTGWRTRWGTPGPEESGGVEDGRRAGPPTTGRDRAPGLAGPPDSPQDGEAPVRFCRTAKTMPRHPQRLPVHRSTPRPRHSDADGSATNDPGPRPSTLRLTTRQGLQAAVAVGLSIVVGELVSPTRWYWAAIAAFVVFAGTNSRGDILSRGWQRILGTVGGVGAGMGLAAVVGGRPILTVALLVGCLFLALYLVRISQALMAFWITAVLAMMYGLIGQFSLDTLVLRIEETAVGALMGMLAGFVVLPRRTARRVRRGPRRPRRRRWTPCWRPQPTGCSAARRPNRRSSWPATMDDALGTLRARTAPLTGPWRRATDGYRDTLHVLAGIDHYARALARPPTTSARRTGRRCCSRRSTGCARTWAGCGAVPPRPEPVLRGGARRCRGGVGRPPRRTPTGATSCWRSPGCCVGSTRAC